MKMEVRMAKEREARIPEAQYVITNQCPLKNVSNICAVPGHELQEPNNWEERAEVIQTLYDVGVRVLKFLGGEPFSTPKIERIIEFTNSLEGLDYAITTNAMDTEKIIQIAENKGLKGVFVSIDSLNSLPDVQPKAKELWGCSTIKSEKGIELLQRLKGKDMVLGANTIVHRDNLDQLPEILKFLTEIGAVMNICPLIWGKGEGKFVYRASRRHPSAFRKEDKSKVEEVMEKLVEMKHKGFNLACPDDYVLNLAKFSIPKMSWTCREIDEPPVIRVGSDLKLMICSDIVGSKVSQYTVFDLKSQYEEVIEAWRTDSDREWCCTSKEGGCYWSNVVRADRYKPIGGSLTK